MKTSQNRYGHYYLDNGVLKNKQNIKNKHMLMLIEGTTSFKAYLDNESELQLIDPLNKDSLKQIHKILFQDIYSFAGQYRDINFKRDGHGMDHKLFDRTEQVIFSIKPISFEEIVHMFNELIVMSPFLKGNSRVARIWINLLTKKVLNKIILFNEIVKSEYQEIISQDDVSALTLLFGKNLKHISNIDETSSWELNGESNWELDGMGFVAREKSIEIKNHSDYIAEISTIAKKYKGEISKDFELSKTIIEHTGHENNELVTFVNDSAIISMCIKYETFTSEAMFALKEKNVAYNKPWAYTRYFMSIFKKDMKSEYEKAHDAWEYYNTLKHENHKSEVEKTKFVEKHNVKNSWEALQFVYSSLTNLLDKFSE